MSKKVKMVLHAEPGVGKSTFASKAPHPFFICTDGNYDWLGLPEEDHIQVYTWLEMVKIIQDMVAHPEKYSKYETIVIDLIEDGYKWCEFEYCQKNKLEHVGDKGYGMGYDIVANQFFVEICKLIGIDKHIIFLTHGYTKVEKDRRGVEVYKFYPSNRIRDKVWDMIEGRVRYFLRAYIKDEEENNKIIKKRYLSLVPKGNEFGIARGLDESKVPEDIDLDWDVFAEMINLDSPVKTEQASEVKTTRKYTKHTPETKIAEPKEEASSEVQSEEPFAKNHKVELVEKAPVVGEEKVKEEKIINDEEITVEGLFGPGIKFGEPYKPYESNLPEHNDSPQLKKEETLNSTQLKTVEEVKTEISQEEKLKKLREKLDLMKRNKGV